MTMPPGPPSMSEVRRLAHTNPHKLSEQYAELRRAYTSLFKEVEALRALRGNPISEWTDWELIEYIKSEARRLCPNKQLAKIEIWSAEGTESYKVLEKRVDFLRRIGGLRVKNP